MNLQRVVFFFLACVLVAGNAGAQTTPTQGNWKWGQVLIELDRIGAALPSDCRWYLKKSGTNRYQVWKRCGKNNTEGTARLRDVTFAASAGPIDSTFSCGGISCVKYSVDGSGFLLQSVGPAPSVGATVASNQPTKDPGVLYEDGRFGPWVVNDYGLTCIGTPVAGGTVNHTLTSQGLVWGTAAYLRETAAATNSVAATCLAGDTMIYDFGEVAENCTSSVTVTRYAQGRAHETGDCGCAPSGSGINAVHEGGQCTFARITGDPAAFTGADPIPAPVGSTASKSGSTITNADLTSMGETELPTVGDGVAGGVAPGYGTTGDGTNQAPTGGTGNPVSGNGSGSGNGTGTGTGDCTAPECEGLEGGVVPGVPNFNTDLVTVEEQSWTQAITDFIASSPISSIFSGAGISTSGASCTISGAGIKGASINWNVCDIPGLNLMPAILLALSHLVAFFIVWRR